MADPAKTDPDKAYEMFTKALRRGQAGLDELDPEVKKMAMGPAEDSLGPPSWSDPNDPSSEGYDILVDMPKEDISSRYKEGFVKSGITKGDAPAKDPDPFMTEMAAAYKWNPETMELGNLPKATAFPASWNAKVLSGGEEGLTPDEVRAEHAEGGKRQSAIWDKGWAIDEKLDQAADNFKSKWNLDLSSYPKGEAALSLVEAMDSGLINIDNPELEKDLRGVAWMRRWMTSKSDRGLKEYTDQRGHREMSKEEMEEMLSFVEPEAPTDYDPSAEGYDPIEAVAPPDEDPGKAYRQREAYKGFRMPKGMSDEQIIDWKESINDGLLEGK
tara:strand:- start:276 stop:1259 length:984 start_codon:yes stop_codon:yes gene_type:complete